MTSPLLFPAILSLLVTAAVLSDFSVISIVLLILWFFRLLCLREPKVVLAAVLLGTVIGWRTIHVLQETKTILDPETEEFDVAVYPETFEIDGDRLQFYGNIEKIDSGVPVDEEIVVFYTIPSKEEKEKWQTNGIPESVSVQGQLEIPRSQRNPHQFDYASFLKKKQIHWVLEAENLVYLSSNQKAKENEVPVVFRPAKWRYAVLSNLNERLTGQSLNYTKMMLFADKRGFDPAVRENFQKMGIVHLLSISGLHIHFLIGGLEWVLLRIGLSRERIPLLFIFLLPVYGTLAGWGTSVFRAVCQSWFIYAGRSVSYPLNGVTAWALTLLLGLFLNPYIIYSVGFQLSYALSLTLLLIRSSKWYRRMPGVSINFVTSFVLSVVSIPILSYHFFEFPWFSLLSNLLFIPLFSWLVLPSLVLLFFLTLLFSGTKGLSGINATVNALLLLIEQGVEKISNIPHLTVVTGRLHWIGMVSVCIGILFLFYTCEKELHHKKKLLFFSILCLTAGLSSQTYSPAGKVVMLDVGQGESILIKEPFGKMNVLIDTGGQQLFEKEEWQMREEPYSIAERAVIPVLKSFGIRSLDQVILTHSDVDHTGSLIELSETISIEELVLTEGTLKDKAILPAAAKLASEETNILPVKASLEHPVVLQSGLGVLWPFSEDTGANNDSIVLYGNIGGHSWLFTGDLEESGEKSLIQNYPFLHADILKAGHHGSRTSTSELFLEKISPSVAWISAGVDNWYGHPHEDVVQRLHNSEIDIWRTDQNGGIIYTYSPLIRQEGEKPFFSITSPINNEKQIQ